MTPCHEGLREKRVLCYCGVSFKDGGGLGFRTPLAMALKASQVAKHPPLIPLSFLLAVHAYAVTCLLRDGWHVGFAFMFICICLTSFPCPCSELVV